ncbi:uncharacterized protein B0P05DRAFT_520773 [Gilbertella persicaria]|uniref:uncharacterized protein n=1 Tax=Gilbertella persicaria TaxID=101096 RepID=UPI00221FBD88|nr:uncharacterized protein B0P05DRAFT_520773 [Gilbertella persicaria]KAI8098170.1 hypothetical protein B0P05DRAFT_520773 [Gilbertella persicaria]
MPSNFFSKVHNQRKTFVFILQFDFYTKKAQKANISTSGRKKKELLDLIKVQEIEPVYITCNIANKYGHTRMANSPYHCKLQLIEKVGTMLKKSIAFNPDRNETLVNPKDKRNDVLEETPEKHLLSARKKSLKNCRTYHSNYLEHCASSC